MEATVPRGVCGRCAAPGCGGFGGGGRGFGVEGAMAFATSRDGGGGGGCGLGGGSDAPEGAHGEPGHGGRAAGPSPPV